MNIDTGHIYRGAEIKEARLRGEPIVEVSQLVAAMMELGQKTMEQRKQAALARLAKHKRLQKKTTKGAACSS